MGIHVNADKKNIAWLNNNQGTCFNDKCACHAMRTGPGSKFGSAPLTPFDRLGIQDTMLRSFRVFFSEKDRNAGSPPR